MAKRKIYCIARKNKAKKDNVYTFTTRKKQIQALELLRQENPKREYIEYSVITTNKGG